MIFTCVFGVFLALFAVIKLPFTIDASEDASAEFPNAPRIASGSFGQWKGKWVFIGGRIAGYHGVGGGAADFLRSDSNREVWIVDTTVRPARTYHTPIAELPASLAPVKDEWASTGQLYYQDGATLYIAGGYGEDSTKQWVTFPIISAIDLPRLIEGVTRGHIPPESIAFTRSPLVQSAGGELVKLADGFFYLVMGHVFMGSYTAFEGHSEQNAASVSQTYLNQIRKLKIVRDPGGSFSVALAGTYSDESEFHRRDLTVTKIFSPRGEGLGVYGGVFTPGTQLSYSKPIYLFPGAKPSIDSHFDQHMNTYGTAHMTLYDRAGETLHTIFFGGISRYTWDVDHEQFVENPRVGAKTDSNYMDGMQWSDQISTLSRVMTPGNEHTIETVQPNSLPAFVGTGGLFIPLLDIPCIIPDSNVLDFSAVQRKRTLIGYLYGGIRAYPFRFPYTKTAPAYNSGTVPTKPNDLILKVFLIADSGVPKWIK